LSTCALKLDGGGIRGGPPASERACGASVAPAIAVATATMNALRKRMRVFTVCLSVG
jgi:hypothetical protein